MIRLNLSNHATLCDATGRKVTLTVSLGELTVYHGLRYMNQVTVNVVGVWRKGCAEPMWIRSNLAPERALTIYAARIGHLLQRLQLAEQGIEGRPIQGVAGAKATWHAGQPCRNRPAAGGTARRQLSQHARQWKTGYA